ncbi:hypothetical protein [Thiomicrorhabdus aquaedulcis]|uniref:hypothetical protein n=1 Tax=Thiomicrorhabdus aquaedulcis TaxID=2211106 RepID=UPI000FD7D3F3|nr:hypothetical protein [Thiomicrorhabdus aquaedulcis]
MSCCSGGYCKFTFPDGPPLLDNPVNSLNAQYLFLPYGTLLQAGEVVRIWMESGKAKPVFIDEKIALEFTPQGIKVDSAVRPLPWQLIALDSGYEYESLLDWYNHPLRNPNEQAVVLVFKHPIEVKPSLKMVLYKWLYKLRTF